MPNMPKLQRPQMVDDQGSVTIIFAISLVVLMAVVGFAVDYSQAIRHRSQLQIAADAAALAAASDPLVTESEARKIAEKYFEANLGKSIDRKKVDFDFERKPDGYVVSASMPVNAAFARIAGLDKFDVGVAAKAGANAGETEVYAVIDMSSSFGIAADEDARKRLVALTSALTPGGCEFACHQRDGWEPAGTTSYEMAKLAGISLREDVLKLAFETFVDTYMPSGDRAVSKNLKRMSVIGFSDTATMLAKPTNDVSAIKEAMSRFPDSERVNTKFRDALPVARTMIGEQGSGFGGAAKKTVVLVTDGMSWNRYGAGPNGPIDMALCDQFKEDGILLAVIEVKYLDASGEFNFDAYVKHLYPDVSPALESCASPGMHFLATDSDAASLGLAFKSAAEALRTNTVLK